MNLNIVEDRLQIDLEWYEQLWAFTLDKTLIIPISDIELATTEEPLSNWAEIRAPGTFLPGVIKAGTYYTLRGKEFWYVTRSKDYLTLVLKKEEPYRRIIINIDNSDDWVTRINEVKDGLN